MNSSDNYVKFVESIAYFWDDRIISESCPKKRNAFFFILNAFEQDWFNGFAICKSLAIFLTTKIKIISPCTAVVFAFTYIFFCDILCIPNFIFKVFADLLTLYLIF